MATDTLTIAEKTALAIIRVGRSFAEAAESSNVPVKRVMEMWEDAETARPTYAKSAIATEQIPRGEAPLHQ